MASKGMQRVGAALGVVERDTEFSDLLSKPAVFDQEAYHAMQGRDEELIRDAIVNGAASTSFVYSFSVAGTPVQGVSIIGARQLISEYGGIKCRIVSSIDKTGSMLVFQRSDPPDITVKIIREMEDIDDFYEVVMEVTDIKTGNSVQTRKREAKTAKGKNGTYERPHYSVIADSKALRNGVLSVLPQDVIEAFKKRCLKTDKSEKIETRDDLLERALRYCAKQNIAVDRQAMAKLTFGLLKEFGAAAGAGKATAIESAKTLGIYAGKVEEEAPAPKAVPKATPAASETPTPAPAASAEMENFIDDLRKQINEATTPTALKSMENLVAKVGDRLGKDISDELKEAIEERLIEVDSKS